MGAGTGVWLGVEAYADWKVDAGTGYSAAYWVRFTGT